MTMNFSFVSFICLIYPVKEGEGKKRKKKNSKVAHTLTEHQGHTFHFHQPNLIPQINYSAWHERGILLENKTCPRTKPSFQVNIP